MWELETSLYREQVTSLYRVSMSYVVYVLCRVYVMCVCMSRYLVSACRVYVLCRVYVVWHSNF